MGRRAAPSEREQQMAAGAAAELAAARCVFKSTDHEEVHVLVNFY